MPTKALLYAAEVLHLASHPEPWGIHADDVSFNFAQVMARKSALVNVNLSCCGHWGQTGRVIQRKFRIMILCKAVENS